MTFDLKELDLTFGLQTNETTKKISTIVSSVEKPGIICVCVDRLSAPKGRKKLSCRCSFFNPPPTPPTPTDLPENVAALRKTNKDNGGGGGGGSASALNMEAITPEARTGCKNKGNAFRPH